MATEMPGSGAGPVQPEPAAEAPRPPEPAWTTPPPPAAPPAPQAPAWGAPAQQPDPTQQPAAPQAQWGAAQSPQQQPGWNPQAAQQPAPPPGQWGAPSGGSPYTAAPPPGQPPQQGWGAPGQPGWNAAPPPAKSGNGCLKACLIVGVLLVVLAVIAFIVLFAAGASIVSGLGVDSNGNFKDCSIVSSAQVQTVLGPDTQVSPLSGLANTIGGVTLDKRILPNAENCWVGSGTSPDSSQVNGEFGRIAKYSGGDAGSVFDQARTAAQNGQYFVNDVPNAGDQAFCTGWSDQYPGTGALVRKGNDLVYVSFLIGPNLDFNETSGDNGIPYSPQACQDGVAVALLALH